MRRVLMTAVLVLCSGAALTACGGSNHATTRPRAKSRGTSPSHGQTVRVRHVRGPHDAPVPILMYHVISAPKPGAPYPELYTPAAVFSAQMHALARHGYHGVTLGQLFAYWRHGVALPSKPVVVSFDDGYLSDYTNARPVLRSLGWPGVLDLAVQNIRPGDLTKSQVEALIAAGWEVDSHTIRHLDLSTLSGAPLRREVAGSRAVLRREFHIPVDFFCYPAGRFNDATIAAVRAAGYLGATTTQPGLGRPSQPFTLARIRVSGSDGVNGPLAKLRNPGAVVNGVGG